VDALAEIAEIIDSRHDIAFEAPDDLIEIVNRIMIDRPAYPTRRAGSAV
jgi:hypothetical protein